MLSISYRLLVMPNTMMVRILTVLEELKETQRVHGSMLQSLLRKVNEQQETTELPKDTNLPLSTMEEFDCFEEKAQDSAFQTAMVRSTAY